MHAHSLAPLIIGLTGPAGCGKDTVASILQTHCGAAVLAFADALRSEIVEAYCVEHICLTRRDTKEHPMQALALARCLDSSFVNAITVHHMHAGLPLDVEAPRSPRQIMQWWGTEYRRKQHPEYWVQKARQSVRWLLTTLRPPAVVLTDVRFDNEAALVRESLSGYIWQVKRPGCTVQPGAHTSEVCGALFEPAAVINNSHDIRHLQGLVLSEYAALAWGVPGVRVDVPQQPCAAELPGA